MRYNKLCHSKIVLLVHKTQTERVVLTHIPEFSVCQNYYQQQLHMYIAWWYYLLNNLSYVHRESFSFVLFRFFFILIYVLIAWIVHMYNFATLNEFSSTYLQLEWMNIWCMGDPHFFSINLSVACAGSNFSLWLKMTSLNVSML